MDHVLKDQVSTLLDQGLFSSAQLLGDFLVSSANGNSDVAPQLKAESLVLLGDALLKEREYRGAIHNYKQALLLLKSIPKATLGSIRSSITGLNRSHSSNTASSSVNEYEVRFKIASSYCGLNDNRAALIELEGIPSKAKTLQMHLMMGKLYRHARQNRLAVTCFKECLRQCPYIIEAITALAELGIGPKEITVLFPQAPNRNGRPSHEHFESSRWLQRYVEAQCSIASNDYKGGLEIFSELLQRFPNNTHLLLEIAKVEAIIGKSDEAIIKFEKVRSVTPYVITYMDEYALLLKSKPDFLKLNKLIHDLLQIDPSRPEVFVALSILWERKDIRAALSYAEKSIRADDRHVTGHIMRGNLLLSMDRPDTAVTAFRAAQELRADIRSYQGLVRGYLSLSKTREALYSARQAMNAMPQSSKPLKLVGDVHASNATGREKAKKFYESALRLEPGYLEAAISLAELHVNEGRAGDAVSLLERYVTEYADDSLHVMLAHVFAATDSLQDALMHFQTALRINPYNEAAKRGLERLEKQMKGLDPDAPEDDENEVDDVEGDLGIDETQLF